MPFVFLCKLRIAFSFTKKYSTGMNYRIFEIIMHIYVLHLFSKYITHLLNSFSNLPYCQPTTVTQKYFLCTEGGLITKPHLPAKLQYF